MEPGSAQVPPHRMHQPPKSRDPARPRYQRSPASPGSLRRHHLDMGQGQARHRAHVHLIGDTMSQVNIEGTVNVKQSRGAGTVLMLVFFGWALVGVWWPLIACLWLLWMLVAGVVNIFVQGFFSRTW